MEQRIRKTLTPGFGLFSWFLAFVMTQFLLANIAEADWVNGFTALRSMGIVAALVGGILVLWRSLPSMLAHVIAVLLGAGWAVVQINFDPRLASFGDRLTEMVIRGLVVWRDLEQGRSVEDYYLFVWAGLVLAWLLVYATIWLLLRHQWSWRLVLLNGTILMINLTYASPKPKASFWLFMVTALVLVVFETFRSRQRRWASVALEQQEWLSLRFLWAGLTACCGLLIFASFLPASISNAQLQRFGEQLSQPFEGIQRAFDLPNTNPVASTAGKARSSRPNFSNSSVMLGGARTATNEVVLEVRAAQPEYWRSNAWDYYNGRGWENTTGELAQVSMQTATRREALTAASPQNSLIQLDMVAREPLTQTITLRKSRGDKQLPAATMPYTWSVPVLVEHTFIDTPGGEEPLPNFTDSSIFYSQQDTTVGLTYTVVSLVSVADKQSLRTSSTEYPAWTQRYTQMFSGPAARRITVLASQVALGAAATNPYDMAVAFEEYLRQFPYDDQISAPPPGQDPIEYFLFELQRGYCDYYATSMVLMLRSQGVPARWVQGYATGEYDPEAGAYLVRDTIAHSWPEVYFTGYGWLRFEPTPAGYTTVPERPEIAPNAVGFNEDADIGPNNGAINQVPPAGPDFEELEAMREELENQAFPTPVPNLPLPEDPALAEAPMSPLLRGFLGLLLLLAAGLLIIWALMKRETAGLRPAARVMASVGQLARWGGYEQRPEHTPHEWAEDLALVLPKHKRPLRRLADAYTHEQYSLGRKVDVYALHDDARTVQQPLIRRALRHGWRTFLATLLRQRERLRANKDQE